MKHSERNIFLRICFVASYPFCNSNKHSCQFKKMQVVPPHLTAYFCLNAEWRICCLMKMNDKTYVLIEHPCFKIFNKTVTWWNPFPPVYMCAWTWREIFQVASVAKLRPDVEHSVLLALWRCYYASWSHVAAEVNNLCHKRSDSLLIAKVLEKKKKMIWLGLADCT